MNLADQINAETVGDDVDQPALFVLAKPATGVAALDLNTGITPQVIAVIQTAATAFVGKRIRIVSVRLASAPQQDSSSWAAQGRNMVQASHNLVQRGG